MNVWTALFSVASFVAVAAPFLLRPNREPETEKASDVAWTEQIRQIRWAMEELSLDAASGKISETDRDALRAELEEELTKIRNERPSSGGSRGLSRG